MVQYIIFGHITEFFISSQLKNKIVTIIVVKMKNT